MTTRADRVALASVHGAIAATLIACPDVAARALGSPRGSRHLVLRLLGMRHAAQAVATATLDGAAVLPASAAVDAAHGVSCLLLAAVSRRERTPALRNAALAGVLAAATALASRTTKNGAPR